MKLFKKIFFALAIPAVIFSCDPLEDVYTELDEEIAASGADAGKTIAYTLTTEDYDALAAGIRAAATTREDSAKADFVEDNQAFSTDIPAKDYLGDFVNENYPQFELGAAVQVSYNFFNGDIPDYDYLLNGLEYSLDQSDYSSVEGGFPAPYMAFPGNIDPNEVLPGILANSVQDPENDGIYFVEYNLAEETSVPDPNALFKYVENEDVSGMTAVDITMDEAEYALLVENTKSTLGDDWIDSFGTLEYFYGSNAFFDNFDARVDEENNGSSSNRKNWISENNLDDDIFEGSTSYTEDSTRVEARIREGVLKFLSLQYPNASPDDNNVYNVTFRVFYGNMGDGFVNKNYTVSAIPTGEQDVIRLNEDSRGAYYTYSSGSWELTEGVTYLNSEDYDAMGAPGRFNNFSSSNAPGDYLPEFLESNVSFPQEGDTEIVVYKYFDGGVSTFAEAYTFTGGEWSGSFFVEMTDQFVHDGTQFIFDPSVVIFMTADDYQIIVEAVKSSNPDLVNSFGTGEDLYGADSFFENFDIRVSSKEGQSEYEGLSDDDAEALAIQRANEGVGVFLANKFTEAQPIAGLDIFYTVNYATFNGEDGTGTVVYRLVGVGAFEIEEE